MSGSTCEHGSFEETCTRKAPCGVCECWQVVADRCECSPPTSLRSAISAALTTPGALTATARAIAPAWGVSPESAQSTLCAWLHGRRKAIPLRAIEAALAHLDIEPEARAELARLRGEIERAERRTREIVG